MADAELLGTIDEGLRSILDAELPHTPPDIGRPYTYYSAVWLYGQPITPDRLDPAIVGYLPIIKTAIALGGLSLSSQSHLELAVKQGDALDIAGNLGWHVDGPLGDYRRVIISNRFGTLYQGPGGSQLTAPDYSYLVIDGQSRHAPQAPPRGHTRTLVQVTRTPRREDYGHINRLVYDL